MARRIGDMTALGFLNMTGAAGAYARLPQLTTAQRTALTGADGMIVYDTDVESYALYHNGAWKFINEPAHFSALLGGSISATSALTLSVALNKKGYTCAVGTLQGPRMTSGSDGNMGVYFCSAGQGSSGNSSTVQCAGGYNSVFDDSDTPNQISDEIFDASARVNLRDVRLNSVGDTLEIVIYNVVSVAATYSVRYNFWVW